MKTNKSNSNSSFSGSIGFVLAAAGSAVGLGNIWRFPYLAAKDGGGIFLLIYIVLALTFGFTLLTTEISIGRKTKQSPLTAYGTIHKKFKFLGPLAGIVPAIILPYYCVIGGWVLKYLIAYITSSPDTIAEETYFTNYITSDYVPIIFTLIFLGLVSIIVIRGVKNGIESFSRVLMPILLLIVIGIAIFSLTIKHTNTDGTVRTGLDGFMIYIIPDFSNLTFGKFFGIVMDAVGQLFYSLSVAMGILIAYGSYVKDDTNLMKSINQIEIFDTVVAFLAGVMIIPAVFAFMGAEGMEASGPGLMFVSLPRVFLAMGSIGKYIAILFFAMVLFAALTSAVSVLEAIVSCLIDKFHLSRVKATVIEVIISTIAGICVCLGYTDWYFDIKLPNGAHAQLLDIMDYISNNCLMPMVAIATCVLVGWVVKPKFVIDEVEKNGEKFVRKRIYIVMIKYIVPLLLIAVLLKSTIL